MPAVKVVRITGQEIAAAGQAVRVRQIITVAAAVPRGRQALLALWVPRDFPGLWVPREYQAPWARGWTRWTDVL